MTLRTRLLIVLVGIVLIGLLVSGIVTYKSLESFLVSRLDQQLENSPNQAYRALNQCIGIGTIQCATNVPAVPPGTFGQLRANGGSTYSAWFLLPTTREPAQPVLPANPPVSSTQNPTIFSVVSSSGLTYRAIAVEVAGPELPAGGVVVVAVPLTEVDQTLDRLLLVELLVSGGVLLLLGALAWWIVRGTSPIGRDGDDGRCNRGRRPDATGPGGRHRDRSGSPRPGPERHARGDRGVVRRSQSVRGAPAALSC